MHSGFTGKIAISLTLLITVSIGGFVSASHNLYAEGITSLTNKTVSYQLIEEHHVKLKRGDVSVIVADNNAIDIPELPNHRAGYNGIASLKHTRQAKNVFVPSIAGLNFEHIHDGTKAHLAEKFEPRKFPMQLRRIDQYTVELYQAPTGNWKLESCGRYSLLPDGTIEYTFECIPRANDYSKGYIGLFWASYINKPEDKAIHFKGRRKDTDQSSHWIKATTPSHGVESTHQPSGTTNTIEVDADFPLTLVGNLSNHEYVDSWYYGVSRTMALAFMFRPQDEIWFAQSPSGGGNGNPAWDFQWFIRDVQVGKSYGFTMRAAYTPFDGRSSLEKSTQSHRATLRNQQR
ncbi:hypothetical protein N9F76_00205 [bacterium]|jgi:hypothetical protein|nr:hypothetical protein [bacterium]